MNSTSIEWTDATWNPLRGCSRVSPGCVNCYAEAIAVRFSGPGQPYEGFADRATGKWTGKVALVPEHLSDPLRWRKPRRIFVNSTSDLFHESMSNQEIAAVFGVMAECPQHTFQVLTKRAKRMADWFRWVQSEWDEARQAPSYCETSTQSDIVLAAAIEAGVRIRVRMTTPPWPLANVWLLVSVEDQQRANERIPYLLKTPAARRGVSYEPALGPVDFRGLGIGKGWCPTHDGPGFFCHGGCPDDRLLDWIIVGGESGRGARPFDLEWAHATVAACRAAGVPVFVKQLGARPWGEITSAVPFMGMVTDEHGRRIPGTGGKWNDPEAWPEALRVREFPGQRP